MRARSFALLVSVTASLALSAGCGGALDKLLGKDSPTPTPSGSLTPTPSGTVTATPTPSVSTAGEITTVDWGTVSLPAGSSPTFSFTAPAGTIDVEMLAIGAAADASDIFAFFTVSSPAGQVIDNAFNGEQQSFNSGLAAFSLPSSDRPAAVVSQGNYSFHVAAFSSGTGNPAIASHPHVMAKYRVRAGGLANSNILKLNLVVVNGARTALDATLAQSDPEVQGALSEMNTLYSTVGITVQVDGYYDFSDSSFATISTEAELEQLFTHSGDIPNDYLTIFLINGFGSPLDTNGSVAGIAGGIPVPNKLRGTLHSGVAVALQGGTGVITGEDMAHEAGHSLGLYHTTEFDDQTHDPISDTPECSTASSNPSACPDFSDVMFPQLSGSMTGFSAGQGVVIRPALAMESGASFAPSTATGPDIHDTAHTDAQQSGFVITCTMQRKPIVPAAPLTVIE